MSSILVIIAGIFQVAADIRTTPVMSYVSGSVVSKSQCNQDSALLLSNTEEHGVSSYNSAMFHCYKSNQPERALEVFQAMRERGVKPDIITYNYLMNSYTRANNPRRAIEVYHSLVKQGIKPNVWTYNGLINAYVKSNQREEAIKVLDTMQQHGIEPDAVSYTSLIGVAEKSGNPELALHCFEMMKKKGRNPDLVTYNILINAVGLKGKNPERAMEVFHTMRANGIKPNVITYSALITVMEKCKVPQLALDLWELMLEDGVAPDTIVYTALISAMEKANQPDKVLEIFQNMLKHGVEPNGVTFTYLLNACGRGSREMAYVVFQTLLQNGQMPDATTYSALVAFATPSRHQKLSTVPQTRSEANMYQTILRKGAISVAFDYASVVHACEEGDHPDHALKVLQTLLQQNDKNSNEELTDVSEYNTVISACARGQRPDRALVAFQAMLQRGVRPDDITYDALDDACGKEQHVCAKGGLPAGIVEAFLQNDRSGWSDTVMKPEALYEMNEDLMEAEAAKKHANAAASAVKAAALIELMASKSSGAKASTTLRQQVDSHAWQTVPSSASAQRVLRLSLAQSSARVVSTPAVVLVSLLVVGALAFTMLRHWRAASMQGSELLLAI
eukprot:gnl/MRDRNA2_/MRDRNA2_31185_c0_seq2.p1 gnl/MRDRNA2_/MRDRNA2_31185_c0~~gnl/MRDRNA2_/MRDRNA2_31185_c0_seq2.p1  ORF type:complete len:619 (+),score=116.68 gnl/MRDRNA2_/MRDRNA2_31185_c0_seq2:164-2020(+)